MIRQQIYFQQNCQVDELPDITSFICDINHIPQNIINLPVHIHFPCILELPKVKHDRELEEFLRGKIHCQNFINQDLTFLQPSLIDDLRPNANKIPSEENRTETSPIETSENIIIQEQETNLQQTLAVDFIYDRIHLTNPATLIQPVEPVIGLTLEEQWKKEADPNLTLMKLLGLTSCTGLINTTLQTLDGLHVNHPSRFHGINVKHIVLQCYIE